MAQIDIAAYPEITTRTSISLNSCSTLLLLLLLLALLVHSVTFSELSADLFRSSDAALSDPGVTDDVDNVGAHVRVALEHISNQVLELLGVEAWLLALRVSSPEHLRFVRGE